MVTNIFIQVEYGNFSVDEIVVVYCGGNSIDLTFFIPKRRYRNELLSFFAGTSPYDMEASVTSPSGITQRCDILDLEEGHYSIKFVPKEMGIHTVSVKHKGMHIPGTATKYYILVSVY